jgi:hypothetical protein
MSEAFVCIVVGKKNTTDVNVIQLTETNAQSPLYQHSSFSRVISYLKIETTGTLTHAPSENVPGAHPFSFLQIHRAAIGIEYATYRGVIEMEKTALIACVPANTNAPSKVAPIAENQTVLTGVLVNLFIR